MPTVTINQQTIAVPDGTTIIQAAEQLGIEIPRYCYHPGLSIAGSCRMCLVEVEKMSKLQPACNTRVTEGMVVSTRSEKVRKAVSGVLEFLLINHPLDCPVCDQAGECFLQEYYMRFGLYDSRMDEDKIKRHKAEPIGPHVILDTERCILCSRCVRFVREISKSHEIGILNRGSRSEIRLLPGKALDNPYSANVVDICPVGALLDRDFRFQCRVWYLDQTPSICPGCSRGCNINIDVNKGRPHHADGRRVIRLKPRFNAKINEWWMCDEGRYGSRFIDDPSRLIQPSVQTRGGFTEVSWAEALRLAAEKLGQALEKGRESILVLPSAQLTNEDLFLIRRFLGVDLGIAQIDFRIPDARRTSEDDFLIRADKNPNTWGARAILTEPGGFDFQRYLESKPAAELSLLYVLEQDLVIKMGENRAHALLDNAAYIIYQGSNANSTSRQADLILPSSTYAETDGTFTNFEGRVQRIHQAVEPLGDSRWNWKIMQDLACILGKPYSYTDAESVFSELTQWVVEFEGLDYEKIGEHGVVLPNPTQTKVDNS
ncbi:MAG TPA: molybdopterin-dependent oxidoreductase [Terriglobia bacterium]|nr:molybdopterin-dependent oxidoreductase [Terriglobia bacterium]